MNLERKAVFTVAMNHFRPAEVTYLKDQYFSLDTLFLEIGTLQQYL